MSDIYRNIRKIQSKQVLKARTQTPRIQMYTNERNDIRVDRDWLPKRAS